MSRAVGRRLDSAPSPLGETAGAGRRNMPSVRAFAPINGLLLAACVALPAALMALGAWVAWRDAWTAAAIEVEQAAETVAQFGGRILGAHAVALDRMAEATAGLSDAELEAREETLHQALRRILAASPGAVDVRILGRDGRPLASAAEYPARPAATDGSLTLNGSTGPRLGRVEPDPVSGSLVLPLARARPAADGGGMLLLLLRPDRLAAGLRNLLLRESDVAALLRIDGALLARSTGQTGPATAAPAFTAVTATGRDRVLLHLTSATDGTDRLVAARRVEGWPVYAVAARRRDAVVARWRGTVAGQLAIGLPATIALLALALAVRRSHRALATSNAVLEARVAARTAELADNEARLQGALEAGRVFAFEYHPAEDLVIRSPGAAGILGLEPGQALRDSGTAFMAGVHPEDRGRLVATLAALSPDRPGYAVRFRYRPPGGGIVWLQDQGAAEFGPDRRMHCLKSLSRDVTQEVAAEDALREAEIRLRVATEGAGIGTYEIDLRRNAIWADVHAARVIGLPAEHWVPLDGPDWAALEARIHPDDRAAFAAAWTEVVEGDAPGWSVETRLRQPDGGWLWDWCHGVAQDRDPATGRPARVIGVVRDMTELRQMQGELRQGQKLQALGELAGGIAHDVNNVLQAISGSAAMALRQIDDSAAVRRRLQAMTAAVARGGAITQRLLSFSRRHEDKVEPLDPVALLTGLQEILQPSLGPQIRVVVDAPASLPPLLSDRDQLQTALINLATNARDAMPRGGVLTLAARVEAAPPGATPPLPRPGRFLRIEVRDTGKGMDAATLARVMEPFFTTKPEGEGTGLGLPLAKAVAERAGGGMTIDSEPGRGTRVTLWLPEAPSANAAPGEAQTPGRCGGLQVLLVDDDPMVLDTLSEQLLAAGISVTAARDAAAALAALGRGQTTDALITDLAMPGLDGLALIAEARRRRPGLAALVVTGRPEGLADLPPDLAAGGPCIVLRKPASSGEILRGLASLLDRAA